MKTVKQTIKSKVKAKAAAVKEKLKGAKPTAAKCCTVAALAMLAALAGCLETQPASRATTATYRIDITLKVDERAQGNTFNMPFTLGDGALASADSAGSTETQTTTPTMDIKPDIDVEVPVNKSGGGAQSVGSVLGDAAASAVKGLMSKTSGKGDESQLGSDSVKVGSDATAGTDGTAGSDGTAGTDGTCPSGACEAK